MTNFKIEDIELRNTDSKNLEMSVSIAPDGLSFCLYHRSENKFLALGHLAECNTPELQQEWFVNSSEAKYDYLSVRLVVCTARSLIVPAAVFREASCESVFDLHFGDHQGYRVMWHHLRKTENFCVFAIEENLFASIQKKYQRVIWMNQASPLIENNITRLRLNNEKPAHTIHVNMYSDFFDLMCCSGDKLLLYNSFRFKSANDIVYFVLSVFEQYRLNQESTHVIFSGIIEKDNLAIIKLKKFISLVYFESRNSAFNYFYKFQDIQSHHFYNLLNSLECE